MAESGSATDLQKRLAEVSAKIDDSLKRQADLEKTNSLLTWAIVIVVFGFMYAGWYRLQLNFAPMNVQESMVVQGPEIMTQVADAVTEAAGEVIPVYYSEAQKKSVETLPRLAMKIDEELSLMSSETSEKVTLQLDAALKKTHENQKKVLHETFPDLTDEQLEQIANDIMVSVHDQVEGLTGYVLGKTVGDIAALDKTLRGFDTKNLPNSEQELSRLMVHHLINVLDCELMEMKFTPKAEQVLTKKAVERAKSEKGGKK